MHYTYLQRNHLNIDIHIETMECEIIIGFIKEHFSDAYKKLTSRMFTFQVFSLTLREKR